MVKLIYTSHEEKIVWLLPFPLCQTTCDRLRPRINTQAITTPNHVLFVIRKENLIWYNIVGFFLHFLAPQARPGAEGAMESTYVFKNYHGGWHFEIIWLFQPIPMHWITVVLRRANECFTMREVIITMETHDILLVIISQTSICNNLTESDSYSSLFCSHPLTKYGIGVWCSCIIKHSGTQSSFLLRQPFSVNFIYICWLSIKIV